MIRNQITFLVLKSDGLNENFHKFDENRHLNYRHHNSITEVKCCVSDQLISFLHGEVTTENVQKSTTVTLVRKIKLVNLSFLTKKYEALEV